MKFPFVRVALLAACVALAGCQLVQPKPENLEAIGIAAEELPKLVDSDQRVSSIAINALAKKCKQLSRDLEADRADYELLFIGAEFDSGGGVLPPRYGSDGAQLKAAPAAVQHIITEKTQREQVGDLAIDGLVGDALVHPSHKDLRDIAKLLSDYLQIKMTDEERRAALAKSVHDFTFTKKERK